MAGAETPDPPLTDAEINEKVGVLLRREIEARILAPLIKAFAEEFDREKVYAIVTRVIKEIARQQGRELAQKAGGTTIAHFVSNKGAWRKGGALETDVLRLEETQYDYNVTRCRYAEMYHRLGIPEIGFLLSCNRDFAFGEGFSGDLKLTRTQTIMQGAASCDFRYRTEPTPSGAAAPDPETRKPA
jgi:hypothetical protein